MRPVITYFPWERARRLQSAESPIYMTTHSIYPLSRNRHVTLMTAQRRRPDKTNHRATCYDGSGVITLCQIVPTLRKCGCHAEFHRSSSDNAHYLNSSTDQHYHPPWAKPANYYKLPLVFTICYYFTSCQLCHIGCYWPSLESISDIVQHNINHGSYNWCTCFE